MTEPGIIISSTVAKQLDEMYRKLQLLQPGSASVVRQTRHATNRRQCQLTAALDAPADVFDDPTTATFEFLVEGIDGQLKRSGITGTLVNHDPNVSAAEDDYLLIQRTDGLWMPAGGSGDGGGSSGGCSCICVAPDMIHPAGFETSRNWTVPLPRNIPFAQTNDGTGQVSVPAGSYAISWNATESKWVGQFDSLLIVQKLDGTGGTASSVSLRVEMEWTGIGTRMPVRFIYDAVGVA